MTALRQIAPETLQQAAEMFVRVRTAKIDSDEYAEWLAWIEADPAHPAAFAEIQQAWDVAGAVKSPPWPHAEALTPVGSAPARYRNPPAWALAAGVVLAVAAFWFMRSDSEFTTARVTTGRGEQQSTVLPDGSRIELGGHTAVAVTFTPNSRLIVAEEGEAFYKVAPDPSRPFVVKAGPVSVTALGTAFSIRREGDAVSVLVTEGLVEVRTRGEHTVRAQAGERVRFDRGQLSAVVEPVKTELTSAWRRGRLRFEEEPLRVVVASLNRYSSREIVLADPSLGELEFTGTVFDDRVEDWLSGVQVVFPVRLRESASGRVVIEPAR